MGRLKDRQSRLTFITEDSIRYRGRLRNVVVEVDRSGFGGTVRLEGTRKRFPFSFGGLYNSAVRLEVERERAQRKKKAVGRG